MPEKKFYQLECRGPSAFVSNTVFIRSTNIFSSLEEAERMLPKFKKMCEHSSRGLMTPDPKHAKYTVVELSLWEE